MGLDGIFAGGALQGFQSFTNTLNEMEDMGYKREQREEWRKDAPVRQAKRELDEATMKEGKEELGRRSDALPMITELQYLGTDGAKTAGEASIPGTINFYNKYVGGGNYTAERALTDGQGNVIISGTDKDGNAINKTYSIADFTKNAIASVSPKDWMQMLRDKEKLTLQGQNAAQLAGYKQGLKTAGEIQVAGVKQEGKNNAPTDEMKNIASIKNNAFKETGVMPSDAEAQLMRKDPGLDLAVTAWMKEGTDNGEKRSWADGYAKFKQKGGSGQTAFQRNAQWLVDSGTVPDIKTAQQMLNKNLDPAVKDEKTIAAQAKLDGQAAGHIAKEMSAMASRHGGNPMTLDTGNPDAMMSSLMGADKGWYLTMQKKAAGSGKDATDAAADLKYYNETLKPQLQALTARAVNRAGRAADPHYGTSKAQIQGGDAPPEQGTGGNLQGAASGGAAPQTAPTAAPAPAPPAPGKGPVLQGQAQAQPAPAPAPKQPAPTAPPAKPTSEAPSTNGMKSESRVVQHTPTSANNAVSTESRIANIPAHIASQLKVGVRTKLQGDDGQQFYVRKNANGQIEEEK